MKNLTAQIKSQYTVIDTATSGNSESLTLEVNGRNFTVIIDPETLTIYSCFKDSCGWNLLPGSKSGKSFKTVSKFISARTQ